MFHSESFLLGFILCFLLLLPFVFFDLRQKRNDSKMRVWAYCILSWLLFYLFLSLYDDIGMYYLLHDLWSLWIIIDSTEVREKIDRPFMFNLDHKIKFVISYSIMFLWWLYFILYYMFLKFILVFTLNKQPWKK